LAVTQQQQQQQQQHTFENTHTPKSGGLLCRVDG
jgi:hypothetical protein